MTYNLFNSSNHLLSNQADHPQGIRCAGVLRISEYILLDPDLLRFDVHAFPDFSCAAVGLGDSTEVKRGDTGQVAQHVLPVGKTWAGGSPYDRAPPLQLLLSLPTARNGGELDYVLGGLGSF